MLRSGWFAILTPVLFAMPASCSTASSGAGGLDGGMKMSDGNAVEPVAASGDTVAGCNSGPQLRLSAGRLRDDGRGFEFAMPAGFGLRDKACGLYPALEEVTPVANHEPRRVELYASDGAFPAGRLVASHNPASVTIYLVAGYGQESGQVSDWSLVVPGEGWFLTLKTDASSKAVLEGIAADFRWTR
jgi:hypothetical protein